MTFYVKKSLAHGPIRFGVLPRLTIDEIDSDTALSTGAAGEFTRRRSSGFFSADTRPIGAPALPKMSTLSSTSFFSSLRPEDAKGWGFIAMIVLGILIVFLGLMVLTQGRPEGWVEILFGLVLAGTPLGITFAKRRVILAQEEKERAEREERERRHQEAIGSYSAALERVRETPEDPAVLTAATRERQQLELPYKVWRALAMRSVLHVGFDALARFGPERARDVAALMDRVAASIGLDRPDATDVKADLYQAVVWHLLADDRLGTTQQSELKDIEAAFGIGGRDLSVETAALGQFDRLRGITRDSLPKQDCRVPLGFREHCIFMTRGALVGRKVTDDSQIILTNKRLIVDAAKRNEVPLAKIDDVEVDVDGGTLTVKVAHPAKPITLQVDEPIYTAALVDIATTINDRPRGFA